MAHPDQPPRPLDPAAVPEAASPTDGLPDIRLDDAVPVTGDDVVDTGPAQAGGSPADTAGEAPAVGEPAVPAPAEPTTTDPAPAVPPAAQPASPSMLAGAGRVLVVFAVAVAVTLLAYLAYAVPGSWFPGAPPRHSAAKDLTLAKGSGSLVRDQLVVVRPDATGQVIISVPTNFLAREYPVVSWNVQDVPANANVVMLWTNDYQSQRIFNTPVTVEGSHLLPVAVAADPNWQGRITGVALVVRGALAQPLRVGGVTAKPMGASELLADRAREWFTFERWRGTSINVVVGGAEPQPLPLPLLLALAGTVTIAFAWGWRRFRTGVRPASLALAVAVVFAGAWLVLDARWMWNLARQVDETSRIYAGKDVREKRLASEDAVLYDFIEKARALMPPPPARVFVVSDFPYLRLRGAYHLYPYNVYSEPVQNVMPPRESLRPGDWMVVFQRRGVEFDPSTKRLRWDGAPPIPAELRLTGPGAALFELK